MRKFFLLMLLSVATAAMAQRTPTMGWSSWNTFALNINENLIRQQADAMHKRLLGWPRRGWTPASEHEVVPSWHASAGRLHPQPWPESWYLQLCRRQYMRFGQPSRLGFRRRLCWPRRPGLSPLFHRLGFRLHQSRLLRWRSHETR